MMVLAQWVVQRKVLPSHCHQGVTCYFHSLLWPCFKPGSWRHNQAVSTYELRFGQSSQSETPCFSSSNLSLLLIDLVTVYCAIASSLQSVIVLDKYEVLLGVWNEVLSLQLDFEMRARITGVNTRMHTFDFLFGVSLGNHLRCHTNNLSKTLQHKSLSSAESQTVAKITLDVLQSLRNEDHFKNFYARVLLDQVHSQVDAPALPKKKNGSPPVISDWLNRWQFSHFFWRLDISWSIGFCSSSCLWLELVLKACKGEACQDELKAVLAINKNRPTEKGGSRGYFPRAPKTCFQKGAPWGFLGCI